MVTGKGCVNGMLTLAGDGPGPDFFAMKLLHNLLSEGSYEAECIRFVILGHLCLYS